MNSAEVRASTGFEAHGEPAPRYVAERHFEPDPSDAPVVHPLADELSDAADDGRCVRRGRYT